MNKLIFSNGEPETLEEEKTSITNNLDHRLILYNDEYNTFDFVITNLETICGLDHFQAEQLTLLVHFKGKATVKRGNMPRLSTMCSQLLEEGLTAEVK